jgi:hypothetical protein
MNHQYWARVARIVQQAARAIHYAHTQGTLHCDIKPANLLVDAEGAVWVTDFGVAKALQFEKLTASGEVTGTLQYTAPERFQGRTEVRSDVYSLGLTLYELLTLRRPFDGNPQQLLRRIMDGAVASPRQLNPAVPRDLDTIVLKAMARDPNARYLTAGAMADDLERYLARLPVGAHRVGFLQRGWRWCRRNRPVAGLSLAVAALLIALVVMAIGALPRNPAPGKVSKTATTLRSTPDTDQQPVMGTAGQQAGANNMADGHAALSPPGTDARPSPPRSSASPPPDSSGRKLPPRVADEPAADDEGPPGPPPMQGPGDRGPRPPSGRPGGPKPPRSNGGWDGPPPDAPGGPRLPPPDGGFDGPPPDAPRGPGAPEPPGLGRRWDEPPPDAPGGPPGPGGPPDAPPRPKKGGNQSPSSGSGKSKPPDVPEQAPNQPGTLDHKGDNS